MDPLSAEECQAIAQVLKTSNLLHFNVRHARDYATLECADADGLASAAEIVSQLCDVSPPNARGAYKVWSPGEKGPAYARMWVEMPPDWYKPFAELARELCGEPSRKSLTPPSSVGVRTLSASTVRTQRKRHSHRASRSCSRPPCCFWMIEGGSGCASTDTIRRIDSTRL